MITNKRYPLSSIQQSFTVCWQFSVITTFSWKHKGTKKADLKSQGNDLTSEPLGITLRSYNVHSFLNLCSQILLWPLPYLPLQRVRVWELKVYAAGHHRSKGKAKKGKGPAIELELRIYTLTWSFSHASHRSTHKPSSPIAPYVLNLYHSRLVTWKFYTSDTL